MTDGFLEFRRQGGFFELEFRRHGGVLTTGIPKASGGFQIWDFQRVQTSDFVGFPFPIQGTSLNECC